MNAAVLSGKLLQMANGAIYDDDKNPHIIHDRKLDALEDLIEGANGKPVLIAYVSAKYSCGFSNLLDSSIIVNER